MQQLAAYTDEHLILLAQKGNTQAQHLLLKRYTPKIQNIIYKQLHDPSYVNDLCQEVLIKVFRHLNDFKQESQFSTWLYRIIHNTIKNHFRERNLQLNSEAHFVNEQAETDNYSFSPEREVDSIEFADQFEAALATLSEELRSCYGLHLFEGQTYEGIAKTMHCPIGTVRSRISRARKLMFDYIALRPLNAKLGLKGRAYH